MYDSRLYVTFVCTGNICRSPMAEKIFAHQLAARGLARRVRVNSAGTRNWFTGQPADPRAVNVLAAQGYPTDHCVTQVSNDHLRADLIVALARKHAWRVLYLGAERERVRLLRSFALSVGRAVPDVEDPYYGTLEDFEEVLKVIESAMPGVHRWVDAALAARAKPGGGLHS
ncbi:low molecular weight protein-tyrosine-phosphatase [Mycobacteroides chelonae]|uniref:low molecular weight protein-tyrosine-phosphatase n=1 Tax=Mycobacteroides chelonae TaxID=1774 RepID=UPI0008AA53D9|nr:low molecular weight protein-tyrosine-phosphatase [Mycobacteroides chelonae]OHU64964.1 protein tyrosine phosphatase [Mycobacteroides chelonae]